MCASCARRGSPCRGHSNPWRQGWVVHTGPSVRDVTGTADPGACGTRPGGVSSQGVLYQDSSRAGLSLHYRDHADWPCATSGVQRRRLPLPPACIAQPDHVSDVRPTLVPLPSGPTTGLAQCEVAAIERRKAARHRGPLGVRKSHADHRDLNPTHIHWQGPVPAAVPQPRPRRGAGATSVASRHCSSQGWSGTPTAARVTGGPWVSGRRRHDTFSSGKLMNPKRRETS